MTPTAEAPKSWPLSARIWGGRLRAWVMQEGWRYAVAFAIVGISCLIAQILAVDFAMTRLAVVFLGSVVLVAIWHGVYVGVFSALLAFAGYNFFLTEPRFTLQFAGPEDVLTLGVFLAVALATGVLAGRVRDESLRSRVRAQTLTVLFQAGRELSAAADEEELREGLVSRIAEAARGKAAIVYGTRVWTAPTDVDLGKGELEVLAGGLLAEADGAPLVRGGWRARALRAGRADLGVALWKPQDPTLRRGDADQDLIPVLADLGAAAIARARLSAEKTEIETLQRTEQLRAALLSSISHDFRTPLSSILASVSSLREYGDQFEKSVRDDLISTIEEESERLNRFVVNLLNMTKLEAGALAPSAGPVDVGDLAHGVESRLHRALNGRRLTSALPDGPVVAAADAVLFEQALANVVDNAVRYSPPGSAVTVTAHAASDGAVIDVEDQGPGVPADERRRIFEKFYRCGQTAAVAGTGLGLSITRGLVEAMGGSVEAGPRRDAGPGLRVTLTLPLWTGT